MTAHVGEHISFETRQGVLSGRISRALGGPDFIVQVNGSDQKFTVRKTEDGRFVIPALVETKI